MTRSIEHRETSEPAEVSEVIPLWRERARRKVAPELAVELDKAPGLGWGAKLFRFYEVADGLPPEARAYLGLIDRWRAAYQQAKTGRGFVTAFRLWL